MYAAHTGGPSHRELAVRLLHVVVRDVDVLLKRVLADAKKPGKVLQLIVLEVRSSICVEAIAVAAETLGRIIRVRRRHGWDKFDCGKQVIVAIDSILRL